MNQSASIYQDMAARTGSSIYIGVVWAGAHRKIHLHQALYGDPGAAQYPGRLPPGRPG